VSAAFAAFALFPEGTLSRVDAALLSFGFLRPGKYGSCRGRVWQPSCN